jgi:hypothetical protein
MCTKARLPTLTPLGSVAGSHLCVWALLFEGLTGVTLTSSAHGGRGCMRLRRASLFSVRAETLLTISISPLSRCPHGGRYYAVVGDSAGVFSGVRYRNPPILDWGGGFCRGGNLAKDWPSVAAPVPCNHGHPIFGFRCRVPSRRAEWSTAPPQFR